MKKNKNVLQLIGGVSWECFMAIRSMNMVCNMDPESSNCYAAQIGVWQTCP